MSALAARVALARLAASLPSTAALLHGLGALAAGLTLLVEPPAGYGAHVFTGPTALLPLAAWGALFTACGVAILAVRGAAPSRWALAVLAGAWAAFGGGALYVGLTSPDAASLGGWAFLVLAASATRAALEFARWPRCTGRTCTPSGG